MPKTTRRPANSPKMATNKISKYLILTACRKKLGFFKKIIPALSSEKAFATLRIPETRAICAFSEDSRSLVIVSPEGNYYDAPIPKQTGQINDYDTKSLL